MSSRSGSGLEAEATVGVMVVDDQAAFRRAARALIEATAGFEALGDAASATEAFRYADQLQPDLVLMDVYIPGMDGFEATRRLTQSHPETVVVLVSVEDLADLGDAVSSCGAVAFARKQDLGPQMLRGLWMTYGQSS